MSLAQGSKVIGVPKRAAWLLFCGYLLLTGCGGGKNSKLAAADAAADSPANLYIGLASAYYERGQMAAALQNGERAVQADNKNANAHYILAVIHQRLGQTKEAEKQYAEALRLAPDNPDILNAHGWMLCLERKYVEALAQFEEALADPLYRSPEVALMNSADCAKRANRGTESERYMREALSANPNFARALLAMAKLSFERGAYQDARSYMARYSNVGQVTPEALLLASRIEARLGNKTDAKALAESLRKRFPDAPQVMQL